MTAEIEKDFDHANVALVDGDMKRSLSTLVPGIQISTGVGKLFDDSWFIAKGSMMHGSVSVLVLNLNVSVIPEKKSNDLDVTVLRSSLKIENAISACASSESTRGLSPKKLINLNRCVSSKNAVDMAVFL